MILRRRFSDTADERRLKIQLLGAVVNYLSVFVIILFFVVIVIDVVIRIVEASVIAGFPGPGRLVVRFMDMALTLRQVLIGHIPVFEVCGKRSLGFDKHREILASLYLTLARDNDTFLVGHIIEVDKRADSLVEGIFQRDGIDRTPTQIEQAITGDQAAPASSALNWINWS